MTQATHHQAEAVYERILDALEELTMIAADDEEHDVDHGEIIHNLAEEAGERGLDEESVSRILKAAFLLTKKG